MARKRKSESVEQAVIAEVEKVRDDPKPKQQPRQIDPSKITIPRERRHL